MAAAIDFSARDDPTIVPSIRTHFHSATHRKDELRESSIVTSKRGLIELGPPNLTFLGEASSASLKTMAYQGLVELGPPKEELV